MDCDVGQLLGEDEMFHWPPALRDGIDARVQACEAYPGLWLFNIAMENGLFIDGLPIRNGDFPWLC